MTRIIFALLAALGVSACATQVTSSTAPSQAAEVQAPPQRVLVSGFKADPSGVGLESGVAARMARQSSATPAVRDRTRLAQSVRVAIVQQLLTDLTTMGLTAVDADDGERPRPGDLLITGTVQKIDQGNRTRRLTVGLGAGKSEVQATIDVAYVGRDGMPKLLQTYHGESNSGRMPGLAVGAAASVAQETVAPVMVSAALGTRRELKRSGVAGEGQKLARRLSVELGKFFVAQQWIEPSRAPSGGRLN